MTRRVRTTLDVSALPTVAFGSRGLVWWGTVGFIVIEGFALALVVASYLYLRRNFIEWPPPRTALPDLLLPTIGVVASLLAIIPMHFVKQAALRFDRGGVARWLVVTSLVVVVLLVLRVYDFGALNSRWDSHAYGSVTWTAIGFHTILLVLEIGETMGGTLLFLFSGQLQDKHFVDATDNAMYWAFTMLSWVPLYVLIYLVPRWV